MKLFGKPITPKEFCDRYRHRPEVAPWLEVENAKEGQKVPDYFAEREQRQWIRSRLAVPVYLQMIGVLMAGTLFWEAGRGRLGLGPQGAVVVIWLTYSVWWAARWFRRRSSARHEQ